MRHSGRRLGESARGFSGEKADQPARMGHAGVRRVLVADDNAIVRRLVEAALRRWGFEVLQAADGPQAWEMLSAPSPPPLAILDWMMPDLNGLELCRRVRSRAEPPYIYIILLTGRSDRADRIEGLRAGADDYVVKPFDMAELEVRLRAGWRIVELEQELQMVNEQLREAALRDPLTGVFHRGAILELLERELARAWRRGEPLGALMIDLDGFKSCNDTRGHLEGDAALAEFVARVRSVVRQQDCLGRYGGDEFLLVAPGCGGADLLGLAERIRIAVGSEPFGLPGGPVQMTASIGAAETNGGRMSPAALIRAADEALYAAKRAGRNRVVAFSDLVGSGAHGGR